MTEWQGWQLGRAVVAFAALFYLGMWVQVTLMHWAGGFKHRAMWGPVVATPLLVAAAVVGGISRDGALGWTAAVVLALGVVLGMVGLALHLRGLHSQIGAFSLRNFLSGPPPVLPMAYALIGLLGLGGLLWHG